jgi:aminomethyltransferase
MVGFAGWHLPLQFSGVLDEHRAVRERVGLFDVSHMGEAAVRGKGALEFLQRVTCNDLSPLAPGRAQYTALTTLEGTFVDDLLVYVLEDGNYLLVTNAANNAKDLAWLQAQSAGFDVTVEDHSDRWAQLAVQGPAAAETLQPLASSTLSGLKWLRDLRTVVLRPRDLGCVARIRSSARPGSRRTRGARHAAPRGQAGALR